MRVSKVYCVLLAYSKPMRFAVCCDLQSVSGLYCRLLFLVGTALFGGCPGQHDTPPALAPLSAKSCDLCFRMNQKAGHATMHATKNCKEAVGFFCVLMRLCKAYICRRYLSNLRMLKAISDVLLH